VIVVITDRRLAPRDEMVARLRDIVAAVPRDQLVVQIREKDLDGGPLAVLARDAIGLGARVWVNDRLDVALAVGAEGVHLPERGMTVADVREVAGTHALRIGCSRHAADGVIAAALDLPDAIHIGPIWPTPSKDAAAVLGPSVLGVRAAIDRRVRLVAVGGIDSPDRARAAAEAGADAVAVIRAAWTGSDPGATIAAIAAAVSAGSDRTSASPG
jgi:thiamine-phosphate pyrophosphorylase